MVKLKVKRLVVSWFNEKIILDSVEIECRFKIILCVVSRKFGRCFFEEYILYRLYVIINNLVSGCEKYGFYIVDLMVKDVNVMRFILGLLLWYFI